jgi:multimeric flavodoxin WrbA
LSKALSINGSPHRDGNTAHILQTELEVCAAAGCDAEIN